MPPKKLKSKPVMLYIPADEKKLFQKHAKKAHTSLSKWIKNAALSYINALEEIQPVNVLENDTAAVDRFRQEITELRHEIAQLKAAPTQGVPDKMAESIFEHLKSAGTWITDQKLHDIFAIETEEAHTDFTVAMHQLQFHHGYEIEFSSKYGWRIKV